jgi:glycosyltransferase involved in cell wall biosynthesis
MRRPIVVSTIYTQEESGSALYRLNMPNSYLEENSTDFQFVNYTGFEKIAEEGFYNTDIFVVSRVFDTRSVEAVAETKNNLKQCRAQIVLDLDDYWVLNKAHISYKHYKDNNLTAIIKENIRLADYVTCSTEYLASRAREINPNITVIKNTPYPNKFHQYVPVHKPAQYTRFGWFGGAQHIEDIALMEEGMRKLCNDTSLNGKYTVTLAGYNDNDAYNYYQSVFSNKGRNPHYNRIPARSVYDYMYGYNEVDVTYAPVNMTEFNKSRSELKVVEAGWMGKTIIASNMNYYAEHIRHGENGFIVKHNDPMGWYKYTKQLILDPQMREGMAKNLQDYVLKNFCFQEIFCKKGNLYKRIYEENQMQDRIPKLIQDGVLKPKEA